ncbi:MAG: hypothetical protein JF592_04375 [Microbacterium sp.]|uniref:hypothetical protein n=1 Tax=Microbacterium sp. TaxID=51671 RepID=UPI001D3C0680|nr:hypothetical protein [Microbacterium sp.]MBW8761809.1 hypothetical protein [Microbacterium sp.]
MNSTNRVLNRALLLVSGVVLLVAGATCVAVGLQPMWFQPWQDRAVEAASRLGEPSIEMGSGGAVSIAALAGLGAAVLAALLLVVFVFTRGRGKTKSVLKVDAERGRTVVDRNVAETVLAGSLAERPDVLSARTGAYLVRGTRAVELAVTVQRGASLDRVLAAAEDAVRAWDALLGERAPIMVHLADRSWRDALRPRTRVR